MENFKQYIGSSEYWYIPVGVFALFVIIAALIGAWNGWKTAAYFLGWNIVGLIVGVLTLGTVLTNVEDRVDLKDLPVNVNYILEHYGSLIILFVELLVVNLLAFLIYWFFRRKLKRTIKENKKNGQSNAAARWIGAGVGVITVMPMTIFMTTTASLTSSNNGFLTMTNSLTNALTFGKQEGYEENDKQDLKDIIDLVNDDDLEKSIDELQKSLDRNGTASIPQAQKDDIAKILANSTLVNSLDLTKLYKPGENKPNPLKSTDDISGITPLNLGQTPEVMQKINENKDKIAEQIFAAGLTEDLETAKKLFAKLIN